MSNKPLKKSDQKKPWMKQRRDRRIIIAPEYHLIVTEGTKTEPQYFQGLKDEINKKFPNRIAIDIEGIGQGANTITLLDYAESVANETPDKYQHVWLVYDKDDFPVDDFDNTQKRCDALSNESIKYHALWSNQCIEYWFLLHFMNLQSDLHRSEYYPKLTECLCSKYVKNRDDIYTVLRPSLNTAIRNAKHVQSSYADPTPSKCSPGTAVYKIFEKLSAYLA